MADTINNYCVICQGTENLLRCGRCKSVHYCGVEHQKTDWTQHKTICNELKSIAKDMAALNTFPVHIGPFLTEEEPFPSLHINDWQHFFQHVSLKIPGEVYRKYVTEEMSWPLTFIAAICKFNLHKRSNLRVHVVGATERYFVDGYMTDLLRLFPLPNTEIVLIGPDIQRDKVVRYQSSNGSPVSVTPVSKCYHDYATHADFQLPDLVVACHPGIQANRYDWKPTLRFLVTSSVPCVFTCWNEEELEHHHKILNSDDIKVEVVSKGPAPFPSTLKRRLNLSKKDQLVPMLMNSQWLCFQGGRCVTEEHVKARASNAVHDVIGVTPSELSAYATSSDDIDDVDDDVTDRIAMCKLELEFIRCLRGGEKQYREKSCKDAREAFTQCIGMWNTHKQRHGGNKMLRRVTSRAHNNIAIIALDQGDVENAIKEGEKATRIDPTYYEAQLHLSHFYSKQSAEATEFCKRALENPSDDAEFWTPEMSARVTQLAGDAQVAMQKSDACKQRAKHVAPAKPMKKSTVQLHYEKLVEVETVLKQLHLV